MDTESSAKKWVQLAEKHSKSELETLAREERTRRKGDYPPEDTRPLERIHHETDEELVGVHEMVDVPYVDPAVAHHEEFAWEDEDTGETRPLHEFKVYLFTNQWANVMAAMERAGQVANSDKACHLLDILATEFNTTYAETSDGGVAHRLDWHVKNLERLYGVCISVDVPGGAAIRKMSRLDKDTEDHMRRQDVADRERKEKDGEAYDW